MKFIPDINNEHVQDCSCPKARFTFCPHREKLPLQGGKVFYEGDPPLEVAPRQWKTHVISNRLQTIHLGKVTGATDWPQGN